MVLYVMLCSCALAILPTEVAVVYNANSALSRAAAEQYCAARRIPPEQMLPLFGVKRGDISREDFRDFVEMPLLQQGQQRGLCWPAGPRNAALLMRAMVLMPDLPLRVREEMRDGKPVGTGMKRTEAAVDSELALLGSRYPTAGMGNNPLYNKKMPTGREKQPIMCVCRIDGPDEESIFRMINMPPQVEKRGLSGWVVVDNIGPYKAGDAMIADVASLAQKHGQPLFAEMTRSTLPPSYPLMQDVIAYFGWYTRYADGPFSAQAPRSFRFADGAIACHLHSYSAMSLYDGKNWVSALLKRGACVTAGNVAEPYLGPCLNYGIFYRHLLGGGQVGEAALLASPVVSWQCIVLGDPLYRPFAASATGNARTVHALWRAIVHRAGANFTALQQAVEAQLGRNNDPVLAEIFALHCVENKRFDMALEYFALAHRYYGSLRDKTRTRLLELNCLVAAGRRTAAEVGVQQLLDEAADSPYLPSIRKVAESILPKKEPPSEQKEAKGK